ncbi:nuclear transport factor 2 family protein [Dyella sp. 20L07]|uniref:nuclear transport factor 2 family protein n=1 Tax=Dyella sp. 20L07 TaxID=3384240 RepID=UPI003D29C6AA
MTFIWSVLPLASSLVVPLHAEQAMADSHTMDRAQIQQLVDRFKGAIIAKNGDAMRAMFLPGGSWLQGVDKASLAKVRAKKPDAKQFAPGNYEQFATFVGTAPKAIEETFDNVRIETDGTIGTVYFDYHFLMEGKSQNHGVETWQLVHTDDGWKISAMLYSVILDDIH